MKQALPMPITNTSIIEIKVAKKMANLYHPGRKPLWEVTNEYRGYDAIGPKLTLNMRKWTKLGGTGSFVDSEVDGGG